MHKFSSDVFVRQSDIPRVASVQASDAVTPISRHTDRQRGIVAECPKGTQLRATSSVHTIGAGVYFLDLTVWSEIFVILCRSGLPEPQ